MPGDDLDLMRAVLVDRGLAENTLRTYLGLARPLALGWQDAGSRRLAAERHLQGLRESGHARRTLNVAARAIDVWLETTEGVASSTIRYGVFDNDPAPLADREVGALRASATQLGLLHSVVLELHLLGARPSEVCLMGLYDVDVRRRRLHIPAVGRLVARTVPVTHYARDRFESWVRSRKDRSDSAALVVGQRTGQPTTPRLLSGVMAETARAAGIQATARNLVDTWRMRWIDGSRERFAEMTGLTSRSRQGRYNSSFS